MKPDIHPRLHAVKVHCGCGNEFETLSTVEELRLEICGACHPYYTGKKRAIAAAGRVQRFEEKYRKVGTPTGQPAAAAAEKAEKKAAKGKKRA